jgi:DNA polymerase-3 subunit delta'
MTWTEFRGHNAILEQFRRSVTRGRLASTYLFVGPSGVGKRAFAVKLAQALLCEEHAESQLSPCNTCESCQQVAANSHPDLEIIQKPPDKSFIPVELFIGDREHRMREGLCHNIALKPFRGRRKIAIIDDADYLNQEGANCLLKTLEEPPPRSLLVLVGTSQQRQLPTIRSRCQIVRFAPLAHADVVELLLAQEPAPQRDEAEAWAALGAGSVAQALVWSDRALCEFRTDLLANLARQDVPAYDLAKMVAAFVEDAGPEAPERRARLRSVLGISVEFFRYLSRTLAGLPGAMDDATALAVRQAAHSWRGDAETAADCLERCLDAEAHVDANVQPAAVIECWLDEVASLRRGKSITPGRGV